MKNHANMAAAHNADDVGDRQAAHAKQAQRHERMAHARLDGEEHREKHRRDRQQREVAVHNRVDR